MIKCRECFFSIPENEISLMPKYELKKKLIDHYQKHQGIETPDMIIKNNFERIEPGQSEGKPCIL